MIIHNGKRKVIWDRLEMLNYRLRNLNGIVQNEMELSKEEYQDLLSEWKLEKRYIVEKLNAIENILEREIGHEK